MDVPSWLLINSMRMETLQFIKLAQQELFNLWRKRALEPLAKEIEEAPKLDENNQVYNPDRVRRFIKNKNAAHLHRCIQQFNEPISFAIPSSIPFPVPLAEKLRLMAKEHEIFVKDKKEDQQRVKDVISSVSFSIEISSDGPDDKDSEIVHENEQEAQEEAEEEAEEEEQKMMIFTRDDEQPIPWNTSLLASKPTGSEPFYPLSLFQVKKEQPRVRFPEGIFFSDNFFRPRWIGNGDRRLKNIALVLEWIPGSTCSSPTLPTRPSVAQPQITTSPKSIPTMSKATSHARTPGTTTTTSTTLSTTSNVNIVVTTTTTTSSNISSVQNLSNLSTNLAQPNYDYSLPRYLVAITLAEGETIRRIIHSESGFNSVGVGIGTGSPPVLSRCALALRSMHDGSVIEHSKNYFPEKALDDGKKKPLQSQLGIQCFRFINNDMYYTNSEISVLEYAFARVPVKDRRAIFQDCLGFRKRERNMWEDTPLAKLFSVEEDWHLLRANAALHHVSEAVSQAMKNRIMMFNPYNYFDQFDTDNDGLINSDELMALFASMHLSGFTARDFNELAKLIEKDVNGKISRRTFQRALALPDPDTIVTLLLEYQQKRFQRERQEWSCEICAFVNSKNTNVCLSCGTNVLGNFGPGLDEWVCSANRGGCSAFNPKTLFYCAVCNRSRPEYARVNF
eukprot:TRINITY_DN11217_c0_g1_i1.p1 TRINITY_DN11217_c0_g1~~TRINITY_DN11217_c0_g1_i1.p1  ORF type:complete len:676 (+),score=139.50 TRINITY_DN11217_c0_g1_i1:721-2748(+)